MQGGGFFQVLRILPFSAYVGSSMLFQIGIWMQRLGVGWLVWQMTESETWLGLIGACEFVPAIVLGPFAGLLADRARPSLVICIGNGMRLVQSALLAIAVVTGIASPPILLALMMMGGLCSASVQPSRLHFVSLLVPAPALPIAVPIDALGYNVARFAGPAIGGFILLHTDVATLLVLNLLWLVPSVVVLAWLVRGAFGHPVREGPARARKSVWEDLAEGFLHTARDRRLAPVVALLGASSVLLRPIIDMLPAFVDTVLKAGPSELASLAAAYGIGSTLGGLALAFRRGWGSIETWHLGGAILGMAGMVMFLQTADLPSSFAMALVCGAGITIMSIGAQTILQVSATPALRGRVMSLYSMLFMGGPAIGAPILGALAERIGLALAFEASTALTALIWLVVLIRLRKA